MSFILDALRKSEHERQRSAVPGLSHVPLATPRRELPPWAWLVMGVLGIAVLTLGVAWWQSSRSPTTEVVASDPVGRSLGLPAPRPENATPTPAASAPLSAVERLAAPAARSPSQPPAAAAARDATLAGAAAPVPVAAPAAGGPTLPSATALMAEGIALPQLRLELHAFSALPSDRFVFINGRKYVEGERLADGPELLSIEPNGAVLRQQGRRFLLSPE